MKLRTAVTSIVLTGILAMSASAEFVTAKEGLRLRSAPSIHAEILDIIPFATEVNGKISAGWMQTEDGYLSAEFLSKDNPLGEYQVLGNWRITAYYETGLNTASGVYPEPHVTAAHNTLPFGTELYVAGYGFWTVQDRGPGSMGTEWMDIYLGDYSTCVQFGEKHAEVYLVTQKEKP